MKMLMKGGMLVGTTPNKRTGMSFSRGKMPSGGPKPAPKMGGSSRGVGHMLKDGHSHSRK